MRPLRVLLTPFSLLYWLLVSLRNWFFDVGILRVTRLKVPVVSVGNISAGGTGKTPFVGVIVRKLQEMGRKPAVLSRGYGRKTHGYLMVSGEKKDVAGAVVAGDEPVELAERLQGTTIVVDEDRVEGAQKILAETSADCIVLDDGFQHRYLHRDLDIVLLTADEILGNSWLLPAGNRREVMSSLRRADVTVISKCGDVRSFEMAARKLNDCSRDRIAGFRIVPAVLRNVLNGDCVDPRSALKMPVVAFSGIGDPKSFMDSVVEFGCEVVKNIEFPDHHWYSENDLDRLRKEFAEHGATMLVTTKKDSVRLRALGNKGDEFAAEVRLHVLEVAPEFIAGEEVIDGMIARMLE